MFGARENDEIKCEIKCTKFVYLSDVAKSDDRPGVQNSTTTVKRMTSKIARGLTGRTMIKACALSYLSCAFTMCVNNRVYAR